MKSNRRFALNAILFFSTFFMSGFTMAQFVTIPDPNFVTFLQANYPTCMVGNQMDTLCPDIINDTILDINSLGISDLTGVEYFTSLQMLDCSGNLLTALPILPDSLIYLIAIQNNLTSIAGFPTTLTYMWLDDNPNLQCLPQLPENLYSTNFNSGIAEFEWGVFFFGTQITCIPNIPAASYNAGNYAICMPGDLVNNPGGCATYAGIYGKVFHDTIANCSYNTVEPGVYGAKMILLDDLGNQIGLSYSSLNGVYHFGILPDGDYTVVIDTTGLYYDVTCSDPGIDSSLTILSIAALDVDFPVACSPGIDVSANAVTWGGWVFPGLEHAVFVYTGDAFANANMTCTPAGAGEIIVTINGPVTYVGPFWGALTPTSISGNVLTYSIADLSTINPGSDISFFLETSTSALIGDTICIYAEVISFLGDINLTNNTHSNCYEVCNSYDPNMKTVYPTKVLPGYTDWLTYTIHFQNTGTASAMNIQLRDTLDALLEQYSFELLASSHPVATELLGNNLIFKFDNIMLPDSTSDPIGSKGFVQYRIKPQNGLPNGTIIENEAYIYFDFNAPILTNTATTTYMEDLGTTENFAEKIIPYPNPSNGIFTFTLPENFLNENCSINIYNLAGEKVMEYSVTNSGIISLDLTSEKSGIYFMTLSNGEKIETGKLVKY